MICTLLCSLFCPVMIVLSSKITQVLSMILSNRTAVFFLAKGVIFSTKVFFSKVKMKMTIFCLNFQDKKLTLFAQFQANILILVVATTMFWLQYPLQVSIYLGNLHGILNLPHYLNYGNRLFSSRDISSCSFQYYSLIACPVFTVYISALSDPRIELTISRPWTS